MSNFKKFHVVVTSKNTWGKAEGLKEALRNAVVAVPSNKVDVVIYTGIVKPEATKEQFENIMKCFAVNSFGGVEMYQDDRSEEDTKMVKDFLVGWVLDESFINKKKSL